jgi:hypothetical protein
MCTRVAVSTQSEQTFFRIGARMASEFLVVDLQLPHAATDLASPAVALQHLPMQFAVAGRIESNSGRFDADVLHETFRLTSDRKAS